MVRKRYIEEQIIGVLKESEAGAKKGELCWKHGMSEATFYGTIAPAWLLVWHPFAGNPKKNPLRPVPSRSECER